MQSLKLLRRASGTSVQSLCFPRLALTGPKTDASPSQAVQLLSSDVSAPSLSASPISADQIGLTSVQVSFAARQLSCYSYEWNSGIHPGSLAVLRSVSHKAEANHNLSCMQALEQAGWTRQAVYNVPNALSFVRLLSGPAIAWLILHEQWGVALVSLAISGATDWADGYVAKQYGHSSVLGSYLDPLADKVLIGCVVGALGYQGSLPMPLVLLIIGRDVILLTGAFVHRFKSVGWRWPGAAEFFRLTAAMPSRAEAAAANSSTSSTAGQHPGDSPNNKHNSRSNREALKAQTAPLADHEQEQQDLAGADRDIAAVKPFAVLQSSKDDTRGQEVDRQVGNPKLRRPEMQPASFVQPLYISKVNTCFQLLLVGACLTSSWYSWPSEQALLVLGTATGGTTLASCGAYVRAYLKGDIK